MNQKLIFRCFFWVCVAEGVISVCHQGPLTNLCGYNGNATEDVEMVCDCQKVIFCSLLTYTRDCGSAFQLDIFENETVSQLHCEISSSESEEGTTVEVLKVADGTFSISLSDDSHFGTYFVFCNPLEETVEVNKTDRFDWEIGDVSPVELKVDSEVKLVLTLNKETVKHFNSTPFWCFVETPDNTTEVLSTELISKEQIRCASFVPGVPGLFTVSVGSDFPLEKGIDVMSVAKHPQAQRAEYDFDFKTILIYFDANIELKSNCKKTFTKASEESLGKGFECSTEGDTLRVRVGVEPEILNKITIKSNNRICHVGSINDGRCLSAFPVDLVVSKPKIPGPRLSFYKTDACGGNKTQNYMSVKIINSNPGVSALQNESLKSESSGTSHRKNLMIWRSMRQVQSKLSSRVILQVNKTDMLPLIENLSELNAFDAEDEYLGSGASVSVDVQSSPDGSRVTAEAHVTFCNDSVTSFRYKWLLNGKELSEEGRLLTLSTLSPGKYIIKCLVAAYDSPEIFGKGWATAEVTENTEEVFITPTEVAVGTTDDIVLRAITKNGNSVSWNCRMASGGACIMRDEKLLNRVYNLNSLSIFLPAGSLPVGEYVWTAESLGISSSAKVFVTAGEVKLGVQMSSIFVNPSLGVVFNGTVRGVTGACRVRWSSVRRKGFGYLRAVDVRESKTEEAQSEIDVPFSIPPSTKSSKILRVGNLYLLKFEAFCPRSGSFRYVKLPIRTIDPPAVFPITVKPLTGKAMITKFEVSGSEADVGVQNPSLMSEWSYVDPCNLEIPVGRGLSRNFTTYLPPGDVRIIMRICDRKEVCSTNVSPTVIVTQPLEIQQENFEKSLIEMKNLMGSGDESEAFGLAVTMLRSLALTAEVRIRKKVLAAVEQAIRVRIRTLSERLRNDPSASELSSQFSNRAKTVEKYFRKDSPVLKSLREFRTTLGY